MVGLVKQFKGTGASGGHGMSELINDELEQKRKEEEKLYRGGLVVGCPKCGESFKFPNIYGITDIDNIREYLKNDCPYCWGKEYCYQANPDKFLKNKNKKIKHTFEIKDEKISCYRLP